MRTDPIILRQIRAFQNELRNESGSMCKELQLWVALVAAEMGQMADAESCRAAHEPVDEMLRSKHGRSDWQSVRRVVEKFFWTDVLMEAWQQIWSGHREVVLKQAPLKVRSAWPEASLGH